MHRPVLSASAARRAFLACLLLLGVSAGAAGAFGWLHWQTDRAARADTEHLLAQLTRRLAQAVQGRRDAVALLRGSLQSAPGLRDEERASLIQTAMQHWPEWTATGLISSSTGRTTWFPEGASTTQTAAWSRLVSDAGRRHWLQARLRLPIVQAAVAGPDRPVLAVLEPLRRGDTVAVLIDLSSVMTEELRLSPEPSLPIRVLEQGAVLYRARSWPGEGRFPMIERPLASNGLRWIVQTPADAPSAMPWPWLNGFLATVLLLAGLAVAGLFKVAEALRRLATTDELTGLANRRSFLERWDVEVERARRYGRELACLVIDVNGFKRVNDRLGHAVGDRVLQDVARALRSQLRRTDLVARFGGDEFIVGLPETAAPQAERVAQKLRELTIDGPWSDRLDEPLSISVGVSQMQRRESSPDIIQRADADLYATRLMAHPS